MQSPNNDILLTYPQIQANRKNDDLGLTFSTDDDETPDHTSPTTIMKPSWPHFGGSAMAFLFAGYSILMAASVFFPPLSFLVFPFLAAQGMGITIGAGIIGFLAGAMLGGWQAWIGYQHYRDNNKMINMESSADNQSHEASSSASTITLELGRRTENSRRPSQSSCEKKNNQGAAPPRYVEVELDGSDRAPLNGFKPDENNHDYTSPKDAYEDRGNEQTAPTAP